MVRQLLTSSVDMHTHLTSFAEGLQERYVLMRLQGRDVEAEVIAGVIRDFDRCTEYCYALVVPAQGVPPQEAPTQGAPQ